MLRRAALIVVLASVLMPACGPSGRPIVIGSKNFTEQIVLGELLAQHLERHTHLRVERRVYLLGTYICHQSILEGRIDLYVEYTGPALMAILKQPPMSDPQPLLARRGRSCVPGRRFHT